MKAFQPFIRVALAAALTAAYADRASAQPDPRVVRGDIAGSVGWLSSNTHNETRYSNNWIDSVFGSASVGWHWTDHQKTELEVGASTKGRSFSDQQIVVDGRPGYVSISTRSSKRTLGISQQYQFFHNVWFHPHVAAGVDVTWERRTDQFAPLYLYDPVSQSARFATLGRTEGPRTSVRAKPFVATGFKAYMTERAFFRSDLRVAFRGGPDQTVLRVGLGVDF